MSDASERLARTRQAIIEQIARRSRKHDPRETPPRAEMHGEDVRAQRERQRERGRERAVPRGSGWFARAQHAATVWWRHHPAHMAVEVAAPLLESYGRRNPVKMLAFAAAAGAALTFARPWRLVSLGGIAFALLKSTHLPSILMSAMSAADFEHDHRDPG